MIESENDSELLRRYVSGQSETAFAELVGRYLGLVYSAALRQVSGDVAAAQDIAQAVFVDLARKASSLTQHPSLAGWLYTSTRFLAANARREMTRRAAREQIAHAMNLLHPAESEPDWSTLQPVLDDVMHDLEEVEREAVLWRFFEQRSFAEIGERLGLKENSARMRVERALDKLRAALKHRGITSTAIALGAILAQRAVGAVPAGLSERIRTATLSAAGAGTVLPWWSGLRASMARKMALAVLGGAALVGTWLWIQSTGDHPPAIVYREQAAAPMEIPVTNVSILAQPAETVGAIAGSPAAQFEGSAIELAFVAGDNQRPIPNVEVRCWTDWEKESKSRNLRATRGGTLRIDLPKNLVELKLSTMCDGFADTELNWRADRGESVPETYVVRLGRAALLGGKVVDQVGAPVPQAKIRLYRSDEPVGEPRPQSPTASAETTTDEHGQWRLHRIAPELLRHVVIYAEHADYAESPRVRYDIQTEEPLRSLTHVLQLAAADSLHGVVLNPEGEPVSGATVLAGGLHYSSARRTRSAEDGSFVVRGIGRGATPVTAEAPGFAPTGVMVDVASNVAPLRLTLSRGARYVVRVLEQNGQPVVGSEVSVGPVSGSLTQAQFRYYFKTDGEGRVEFPNVPAMLLSVTARATGHIEVCGIERTSPGPELVLTLLPSLQVSGRVRHAVTGELIPKFQIVAGRPEPTGPWWSTIDRFKLNFQGGVFRHEFNEGVVCDSTNSGFLLKFVAEGYAPFVSRFIAPGESSVQLDIALQPARSRTITVVNPDGHLAVWADVGLIWAGKHDALTLILGGIDRRYARADGSLQKTDERGQVLLSMDPEIRAVVFANPVGYLEAELAELVDGTVVRLKPWGRIEGTLTPLAGKKSGVHLEFDSRRENDLRTIMFAGYDTSPSETGQFSFALVPPGRHRVVELIPEAGPQPRSWSHARHIEVEVRPGETNTVQANDPWRNYPNAGND